MIFQTAMTNRLAKEKSPYLLQHANNPVDWYAWSEEAFDKARKENKPIFLSIGYSTCHWCHVMEEESFENPEVAKIMNENFVSIKVDREERPDIDNIYMTSIQAVAGQGGWPLNVFLTPEKKPFFGGTYWPPDDRLGQPGFTSVLRSVADSWGRNQEQILQESQNLTQLIQQHVRRKVDQTFSLGTSTLQKAYRDLESSFDPVHGGFGSGIKFSRSHALSFLLRFFKRTGEKRSLEMVEKTLFEMVLGGMWDHLSGGFHRYATDSRWFLPHFEKMLYDQAILSKTYLEAYQLNPNQFYQETIQYIFEYVLRDLRHSDGGFYSAEDADSLDPKAAQQSPKGAAQQSPKGAAQQSPKGAAQQSPKGAAHPLRLRLRGRRKARQSPKGAARKREGAFYVWEKQEVLDRLGSEAGEIVSFVYGIKEDGNVENDPHGEFPRKNILSFTHNFEEASKKFNKPAEEIEKIIRSSVPRLLEIRGKRPRPSLDDKILTDWNGLMISSLALGSRVLGEPRYKEEAKRAADFILKKLVREDGRLLHRYRDGEASILGTIEDYAFFIHGLVDLYEATFEPRYLSEAKRLTQEMIRLFWDKEGSAPPPPSATGAAKSPAVPEGGGGFFFTAEDGEKLITRQKEIYDGAIPSGNSLAALDLLRVGRLTMDKNLEKKAEELFTAFSAQIHQNPEAHTQMLIALDFALGPSREIVIAGDENQKETQLFLKAVFSRFLPNKIVSPPFNKNQVPVGGKPTAYVCKNYVCNFSTTELSKFEKLLDE